MNERAIDSLLVGGQVIDLGRIAACFSITVAALWLTGCETTYTTTSVHVGSATSPTSQADAQRGAQTRLELASNYLSIGRLDVALEEINAALKMDSSSMDAYMVRGTIYAQQRDFASAEADYARVLRARANDPDVLHNYGWILCQQGRFNEGDAYFQRVLQTPGFANSARTLMAKGLCLQSAGKNADAIATLKQAYNSDANNPIVTYNLAFMLYHGGQVGEAQGYLRRLNSSEYANAETLWLGIKVENALGNQLGVRELGGVLGRRFSQSREYALYERGAFYD